ncbi:hypothetical protein [Methanobrevibacter arboriphilus]|uniref:hypothetical protein n=1 Tax=Methanobrevibacter arboriphilus TaxID=39441 RepID=UPI000AFDDE2D|nr:hypothetical protein [Methanobrevibacter arboriphilus]
MTLEKKDFEIKEDISKDLVNKDNVYVMNVIDFMNEIEISKQENYCNKSYISPLFEVLAEKDIDIFIDAFKHYQSKNYRFINNGSFISTIINKKLLDVEKFYIIINYPEYEEKQFLNEIFFWKC